MTRICRALVGAGRLGCLTEDARWPTARPSLALRIGPAWSWSCAFRRTLARGVAIAGWIIVAVVATGTFLGPQALAAPLPLSGTLDLAGVAPGEAAQWTAADVNGLAGAAVAGIGDFDGDGRPDLAVGEPGRDTPAGPDSGAVHVVLDAGRGGGLEDSASTLTIRGAHAGDRAGFSVHGAGDVNGDGLADVVIGAPNVGAAPAPAAVKGRGEAYVVFGRRDRQPIDLAGEFGGWRITGSAPGDDLGRAVSSIPDLNGDGLPEVIVSAPRREVPDGAGGVRGNAGSAYVVFGQRDTAAVDVSVLIETGQGWRIDGPVRSVVGGAYAGRAVSSIADLNGDGRPEVLVTAPRGGGGVAPRTLPKGLAYVVWGRSEPGVVDLERLGADGYTMTGRVTRAGAGAERAANGDFVGESIEAVGDVNGDARPDVVVGAHLADARDRLNVGIAYVVFGKGDTKPVDLEHLGAGGFRITGIDEQDQTGFDTAGTGDFDGDGIDDIAVTSLFAQPLSKGNAGAAYVVWGQRGAAPDLDLAELGERAVRIAGANEQDSLGFSVAALGDVNGDGAPDLALGAPATNNTDAAMGRSQKAGATFVVFGQTAEERRERAAELGIRVRGCNPAINVQVLMEDNSYTDDEADPERIRLSGLQAYVATPRNQGTVLGVTGFDADTEDAAPIIAPTLLRAAQTTDLNRALADAVDGRDSFPGYPFMVRTFANDNPGATARVLLVDGVTFGDMADAAGLTEGNPPTYVVAVGNPPDRTEDDVKEMRRLARETKGRYYEAHTARAIEKALMAIESRLRCDFGADDACAELDAGQSVDLTDTPLEPGLHSADVRVTWHDPDSGFEVEEIDVIRDDDVVTRIGPEDIQTAYGTSSSRARVSGRRGRGFRTLHIRRLHAGGRLRIIVRAQRGRRGGTVYGRVTLSRRQR